MRGGQERTISVVWLAKEYVALRFNCRREDEKLEAEFVHLMLVTLSTDMGL